RGSGDLAGDGVGGGGNGTVRPAALIGDGLEGRGAADGHRASGTDGDSVCFTRRAAVDSITNRRPAGTTDRDGLRGEVGPAARIEGRSGEGSLGDDDGD